MKSTTTALLTLALALLATSAPTSPLFLSTPALAARGTKFGTVYTTNSYDRENIAGHLEVTGGCVDWRRGAHFAVYSSKFVCRFFKEPGCGHLIGSDKGLQGSDDGGFLPLEDAAVSATCWDVGYVPPSL